MTLLHRNPIVTLWLLWAVYWALASISAKRAVRRESLPSLLSHAVPLTLAVWLMLVRRPDNWLGASVLPQTGVLPVLGVFLVACGLAFSVWARTCLGRNWSGSVTIKRDHQLIRHGPYAWVRHPIYNGLLSAFLGTVLAQNQWRSVVALAIAIAALGLKWRLEETWMQETFGEAYTQYRRDVPAIIPRLRKR